MDARSKRGSLSSGYREMWYGSCRLQTNLGSAVGRVMWDTYVPRSIINFAASFTVEREGVPILQFLARHFGPEITSDSDFDRGKIPKQRSST